MRCSLGASSPQKMWEWSSASVVTCVCSCVNAIESEPKCLEDVTKATELADHRPTAGLAETWQKWMAQLGRTIRGCVLQPCNRVASRSFSLSQSALSLNPRDLRRNRRFRRLVPQCG